MARTIAVSDIIDRLDLEILAGKEGIDRKITNPNLTKPGLELAGMFEFYEYDRVQVLGSKEGTFFHWLNEKDQRIRVKMMFEKKPPAFIFSRNVTVPDIFLELGDAYGIPVLKSSYRTTSLFSELFTILQSKLAERTSMHGVLMDINGVGVLITGESGLGKSEVALELVRRGYILVADDTVEIYQKEKGFLIGEAPDVLKKYLEIRGIGIVNVVYLFGVRAYRENKRISLIVELCHWDDVDQFDRLGIEQHAQTIFDTDITKVDLPITEARNTATLVEAAAFDYKSKSMDLHSGKQFNEELTAKIKQNHDNDEGDDT